MSVEQVSYGFYKKPMASKLILRATTALPDKMKYENAANELIRRINNTHRGMANYAAEKLEVTNAFMITLQISGYSEGFRHQRALAAYRGVRRMEEREKGGGRKVYRYQTEGAVSRHKASLSSKADWFKEKKKDEEEGWVDDGGVGAEGGPSRKKREPKRLKDNVTAKKTETGQARDERKAKGVILSPSPWEEGSEARSKMKMTS